MIQIDIDMPTSCEKCEIWSLCWAEDPHWWKRREDCPLHEVTDMVSRQQVIDTIRKIILGFFSDEDGVMNDTEKTLLSVSKAVCNGVRELPPSPTPSRPQIHCNKCNHYQGVHDVQGHAPCDYWKSGGVLWNWYCSQAEPYKEGGAV